MRQILTTARHLSLDVVAGAVCSGAMVAAWLNVQMPISWWVSLPLSVWVIYTMDHLIDARQLKAEAHTPRHLFHHRYKVPLRIMCGAGLVFCGLWVPFWVPRPILWFGLGMGGLVLMHLGLVFWAAGRSGWLWQKEVGVALIYSAGVWGGPVCLMPVPNLEYVGLPFAQFFLLALMNLVIFSWYERETDELDGQTSLVRGIGARNSLWFLAVLSGMIGAMAIVSLYGMGWDTSGIHIQLVFGGMLLVLLGVIGFPGYFREKERYRIWADGVFLLPGLFAISL